MRGDLNDDDLKELVEMLNMLYLPNAGWIYWQARKDHIDLFGVPIKEYEYYFYLDRSFSKTRLARKSMARLLTALFERNDPLLELARQRAAELREQRRLAQIATEKIHARELPDLPDQPESDPE